MLSDSDWTQLADAPLTPAKQAQWATYRQELRDIPSQPGYPGSVSWPVKPT
ncbi:MULTISPECIES: tail fiber assembly protein [Gemmobacter]|uniref:tail fiber assembly protein n=1 Tax=Gemmobacter sp. LW-1 TaxID=1529005 RepID=UPI000AF6AB35